MYRDFAIEKSFELKNIANNSLYHCSYDLMRFILSHSATLRIKNFELLNLRSDHGYSPTFDQVTNNNMKNFEWKYQAFILKEDEFCVLLRTVVRGFLISLYITEVYSNSISDSARPDRSTRAPFRFKNAIDWPDDHLPSKVVRTLKCPIINKNQEKNRTML